MYGNPFGSKRKLARLSVNVLTGAGGALAAVSLLFSFQKWPVYAMILLILAVLVDAIDGTIIRYLNLQEILPEYDGERLDEYADLLTYVIAPVGFAWGVEGVLPFDTWGLITGMMVCIISIQQFSHQYAKAGVAFWGFPSYWNVLFFYGWALEIQSGVMVGITLFLCMAVFFPIPFIYPSRFSKLRWLSITLGGIWWLMLLGYLLIPDAPVYLVHASFFYPVYYVGVSLWYYPELREAAERLAEDDGDEPRGNEEA